MKKLNKGEKMKHFNNMLYTPEPDNVKLEFNVESTKYRLLIPQKYATEFKVIDYIFDNFDTMVQPNCDFVVPDVNFEKIMKEK